VNRRIVVGTSIRKAVMTAGIQLSCRFVWNSVRRFYQERLNKGISQYSCQSEAKNRTAITTTMASEASWY
jgi:hypothetical protein